NAKYSDYVLCPDITETAVQRAMVTERYSNFGLAWVWGLPVAGLGFAGFPGRPGGRLCGCQGGLAGGAAFAVLAAGAGADGLERVVHGGPQVDLGGDHVAAVVQGAAEAGEQLGEDRLDDGLALLVDGAAFGGVQPGGHGLPAGLAAERGLAAGQFPGLDRFAGDGDVQFCAAAGGEVVLGCVPGVEQCLADPVRDAGGGQVRRGGGQQRVHGGGVTGAVVGADGADDLPPHGQGL